MPYDPKAIANRFLDLAGSRGKTLTPMKLQDLVYYAHGWHLAIKGTPLIDEQVEAWTFGPVIPSLHYDFRRSGDRDVTGPAVVYRAVRAGGDDDDIEVVMHVPSLGDDPEHEGFADSLIRRVWDVYGGFTAIQLSNMTHEPGSPWHQVVTECREGLPKGTDIPREKIRDYFVRLARAKAAS